MRCLAAAIAALSLAPTLRADDSTPVLPLGTREREAIERNPEVQEARHRFEAKRARAAQAGALPDPTIQYGVVNEGRPVPLQTLGAAGFSEVYVGFAQDIPFPGKRRLRERAAGDEATADEWAYVATQRRIAAEVAEAYRDLYTIQATADILERNGALVEQLARVATARYTVGHASQQDVLEAELEVTRLEAQRARLSERRTAVEARLESLLPGSELPRAESMHTIENTPIPWTLAELLVRAEQESPALKAQSATAAQGETRLALARRERLPDLGFSLTYHNRGRLDPYYSFGGMLTLPLYGKQAHAVDEAAADLGGLRSAQDGARARVREAVTQAFSTIRTTERLLTLYDQGILKQARLSLDSALSQYQVGKIDFLTLVSSWRRLLDDELTYHEQRAEHEKAVARLTMHIDLGASAAKGSDHGR